MSAVADLQLDLEVFSGPFDLLLTLVLREEVDLLEVELADVVLAYLDHLEARGVDPAAVEAEFADARYGDFKVAVAGEVAAWLAPVRERYEELRADEGALEDVLAAGAEKARALVSETLRDVRRVMGVGPPSGVLGAR